MSNAVSSDLVLARRLLGYLRPYRAWAITSVVLLIAHSGLGILGPLITKTAIDRSLRPVAVEPGWLDAWLPTDRGETLLMLTAAYALTLVLSYALRSAQIQVMNSTGQNVMFDLRNETFRHLQSKNLRFFDANPVGRLVTRVTSDVDALNELFTSGVAAIAGDVVTLAFIFGAMLWLSVKLTLIMLTVGPLIILAILVFRSYARTRLRQVRTAIADINSFLQESLTGMSTLQLFGAEQHSLAEFDALNGAHRDAQLGAVRAHSLLFPVMEFFGVAAMVVLLLGSGWLAEDGALSIGVVVAFLQYGSRIFRPVQDLSDKFNVVQGAMASSERIFALLDTPVDEPSDVTAAPAPVAKPTVEFDGVWFAYNDENWVLRDVTFRIESYEMMAVVGHTGAGKTTLVSLLLRFYEPQRGRILVGGKDIREWPLSELRRQFGVVLQDPHLFRGTIEQNIRLGDEITSEQARDAAARVQLASFIESLPDGYESEIGERGAALSGGQKQLLSFARALARKTPFLILDEATSNVDSSTELLIRDALAELVEKHTAIVIAHRLSTIKRASRVLVMHKGRAREIGTHTELLAQQGLYWKLYQLQYQGQERLSAPPSASELFDDDE